MTNDELDYNIKNMPTEEAWNESIYNLWIKSNAPNTPSEAKGKCKEFCDKMKKRISRINFMQRSLF